MSNIKDLIKQIIKDNEEIYSLIGTVSEIDLSKRVCTVSPIDGSADLYNVRLQSETGSNKGLVIIPKEGTFVIATFLSKELAFISMSQEIDKILLNSDGFSAEMSLIKSKFEATTLLEIVSPVIALSGQITFNGGIPLTGSLSDQINSIKEDVNSLKEVFAAWTPSSEGALKTALGPYIAAPLELMEEDPETPVI